MENNYTDEAKWGVLDIAVVSMDCRFPDADSPEAYWKNLVDGVESVVPLSDEELLKSGIPSEAINQPNYVKAASFIEDSDKFAASFFGYSAKEAAMMDPQHRVFLELCWHALEKAGFDSEQYKGSIGVFAGTTFNSYLLNNILKGRSITNNADNFFVQILNDKDNLATRVSYKLNLNGPALSIQTACSTSLVAIHYACQSLLNHECDIALAGGVTVRSPHKAGYFYQPDMILSKDGHCRPFDAEASGTIFGSGAGVVALKRLEDALEDGDTIHAIIKGSSVNNDGSEKVGYTAPGRKGQEAVLSSALALAGVPKETITAIEAHGTGTILGDPIEFESLNKVYGSANSNHKIALGSVKSNLGHLECAAGIASFIKMVLCLKNKKLVPSLNFSKPNPHIQIDNTPFYVNTEVKEWKPVQDAPLRCAISSFGIGGTNGHLILEEGIEDGPKVKEQSSDRPSELVLLSARTETALNKMSDNLVRFLRQNPDTDISDMAYTLRTGRRAFEFRKAVVASDIKSVCKVLEENDTKKSWTSYKKFNDPQIVFMFPGQGSQHIRMAKSIYESEPVFKKYVDKGAEVLKPLMGLDIRDILFPIDEKAEEAKQALTRTNITQPVLFVIEYALSCLWMSWGIKPNALVGHSIGEYAAACLAGVISYEDALAIVTKRGELINNLPQGSMCGLHLSEEQVKPFLTEKLSIASINGPTFTVVSGPKEDIDKFTKVLEDNGHNYSLLHTSHAFHSWMMQPAYEPFIKFVGRFKLNAPQIPCISNVTGDFMTAEQATSPEYWASHIIAPVRFSDGADKLLKNEKCVYLEVGPGTTLGTFMKNHDPKVNAISCLPHANDPTCSLEYIYGAAARLWISGVSFDWNSFEGERTCKRLELPVYPFERKSYWIQPADSGKEESFENIHIDAPASVSADQGAAEVIKQGPRNETEQKVMDIFVKTLGVSPIDIRDNFFELGGHSLLAIQLLSKINEQFNTEIKLNDFFKFPTVETLSIELGEGAANASKEEQETEKLPEIIEDLDNRYEPFPLTEMQEAQWLGRIGSFSVGNVAAHVYYENEKEGLDLERLQNSWQAMVDRHEMLRTVLLPEGGQKILKGRLVYKIKNLDLRNESTETVERELLRVRGEMDHVVRPIDQWPLFEVRTTQLPGNKVRIHFSLDLLICDVGSMRILQSEWARLYKDPQAQLPPLNLSFRDYVLAEKKLKNTEAYAKADAYWDKRVTELPLTTAPELPIAKDISSIGAARFKRWSFMIGKERWDRIKEATVKRALSPSSVILAAFSQILGRWSKTPEFCVNTPIINRLPLHQQVKQIVGEFASFAPVAVNLKNKKTFAELAQELQQNSWENLENRYLSGTSLLRKLAKHRGGSSGAVLPVVFTSTIVQKVEGEEEFDNQFGGYSYLISQTPQVWLDHTAMENEKGLLLSWHALSEMFPDGLLDDMWSAYEQFMNRLADDEGTWNSYYHSLLPEKHITIFNESNSTEKEFVYELLHTPILRQSEWYPSKAAIITARKKVSYKELAGWTNGLGRKLRDEGLKRAELVAVIMEKGYEQVAAVLGILQGGGAYLPLDPDLPKERLKFILDSSEVRFILTQEKYKEPLGWLEDEGMDIEVISESTLAALSSDESLEPIQELDDLAYVIFTSGSTGKPKGVMISHRAAQNTILDVNEKFKVSNTDLGFALSELNFDLSVYDIFGILAAGGTLVIPNAHTSRDPEHWLELITLNKVTVWNSVPALMAMLVEYAESKKADLPLRLVMMSGDWIPVNLPSRIKELAPQAEVISLGGATEAAIWSNYYPIVEVDPTWKSIPYGKPLANQQFYVLNPDLSSCPVWVPGELYIGGMGVALGYLKERELTERSFIFHPEIGKRLYRTGDLGRYLPDGNIEFLGREDFQVKISGFRVELEDIEAAMLKYPGIKAAVVNAVGESRDKKRLVGYIVSVEGNTIEFNELKEFVADLVPDYMVPNEYVVMESFPLTPNGKVDRKSLPEPQVSRENNGELGKPSSAVVKKLVSIFAEVLKQDESQIDIHANFFALGGDSIMGIQIISRAAKEGIEISPQQFFEHSTIAKLAQVLNVSFLEWEEEEEQAGVLPLAPAQQWMLDTYETSASLLNWSAVVKVKAPLQPQKLEMAFQYVMMRNPVLQVNFSNCEGKWEQAYEPNKNKPEIDYVDISGMSEEDTKNLIAEICSDLKNQQELTTGSLVKLCMFDDERGSTQYLLFIWNQLIMDLRSFEIILKEIDEVYMQLEQGGDIKRNNSAKHFRHWTEYRQGLLTAGKEADAISGDQASILPEAVTVLNLGNPDSSKGSLEDICLDISKNAEWDSALETAKLKGEELFLTALALTLQKLDYTNGLYVDCVSMHDNELLKQNGFQNVIGQLSSVFELYISVDKNAEYDEVIRTGKDIIRRHTNALAGAGYLDKNREECPHIRFSYSESIGAMPDKYIHEEIRRYSLKDFTRDSLPYTMEVDIVKGPEQVSIQIGYNAAKAQKELVEEMVNCLERVVQDLVSYIQNEDKNLYVASDFADMEWDESEFDDFLNMYAEEK
ncbi:MAG: amino acid adenylation domain-containing protein [Bacillota bacterium]